MVIGQGNGEVLLACQTHLQVRSFLNDDWSKLLYVGAYANFGWFRQSWKRRLDQESEN